MNPFNTKISKLEKYHSRPGVITLSEWLEMCRNGCQYTDQVQEYRRTGNSITKKSLPLVTVGCRLTGEKDAKEFPDPGTGYRVPEQISERTGWISLDIDSKDNPHIESAEALRDELKKIVFVAFAGLSVSGAGVWCLVKVSNPERQADHFDQLKTDFASVGIKLDSSKGENPHDARFYSYDPGAWVRDDFKIYDRLPKPKPKPARAFKRTCRGKDTRSAVEALVAKIQGNRIDITGDYEQWRNIGFSLAAEFGEAGREYFHAVSQFHPEYSERETDSQFSSYLKARPPQNKKPATIDTFFYWAKQYGVLLYEPGSSGDRKPQAKSESPEQTPHGVNPYTGEVFDERGYPVSFDEVDSPEPGTPEYDEAERQAKAEIFHSVPV